MLAQLPILPHQSFARRFDPELFAAKRIHTLQINIGLHCNLACRHCHVESSPARHHSHENMDGATADRILDWIGQHPQVRTIDITGGSPEMNPHFRRIVEQARQLDRHVMDRCNPTLICYRDRRSGQDYQWLPAFLAENVVEVVASMPCYLEDNVDHQRGQGAHRDSIEGLRRLNDVGYGRDPDLCLNLVYNPSGPHLPPPQEQLTWDYQRELEQRFGIVFNELWTIANMPIKRWRHDLERQNELEPYMQLLVDAFNPATLDGLMCRHQIHVDWQGRLYDCDFNHALTLSAVGRGSQFLWDLAPDDLAHRPIATADHCYGCTAGAGSSCGGALV